MNDTLTALTAFVVFLIAFSMIVQAVQEAMKNFLKLKGGVWERFIINIYKKEFGLGNNDDGNKIKGKRFGGKEFIGDFKTRLKCINDSAIKADKLLQGIKKDLLAIINLNPSDASTHQILYNHVKNMFHKIPQLTGLKLNLLFETYDKFETESIAVFLKNVDLFTTKYPDINSLNNDLIKDFQSSCKDLLDHITKIETKISDYRVQIENKFDAWVAQVNGEYKRHMLKWTLIVGAVMVFISNADSFSIYKHLSADNKVQTALIQNATKTMTFAIKTKAVDINGLHSLFKTENDFDKLKQAISKVSEKIESDFKTLNHTKNAKEVLDSRNVVQNIKKSQKNAEELLIAKGEELVGFFIALQKASIDYYSENLASLDLPIGGWVNYFKGINSLSIDKMFLEIIQKVGGLLLTICLVTFGAPFWNNVLTALLGVKNVLKNR